LGGKPVYITEYNSHYELGYKAPMLGQVYGLREALNMAQYLQFFVRKGYPVATQWLLFDDMFGFGLVEGVAIDLNHGNEMGRNNPRPRPSFYMLKLYRDHLEGKLLPVEVVSPRYHIGPPAPSVAMGFVGGKSLDIPFINAVASISDDGRQLSLLVNNLHFEKEFSCTIRVKGFAPKATAGQYIVSGDAVGANNEPETCARGDCVSLTEKSLNVSGPEFSCTFPPHSASALVLSR
jgi:alpha-L-arabinofuranosidase